MSTNEFDLCGYALLEHDSLGGATGHSRALEHFRDSVVHPSLSALNEEISEVKRSEDPSAVFFLSDLEALLQASVEGYLLTVQSMWERGLRGMLVERERAGAGDLEAKVQRAVWLGPKDLDLHDHFKRLFVFPLPAFDSYGDLDFLQALGSAIRHGDGPSSRRVHELCPGLWPKGIDPAETFGDSTFPLEPLPNQPKHLPFSSITLPEALLEQMIYAVLWFWEDIENLRCNSFKRKHFSVVERLAAWPATRVARENKRVWSASNPSASR